MKEEDSASERNKITRQRPTDANKRKAGKGAQLGGIRDLSGELWMGIEVSGGMEVQSEAGTERFCTSKSSRMRVFRPDSDSNCREPGVGGKGSGEEEGEEIKRL